MWRNEFVSMRESVASDDDDEEGEEESIMGDDDDKIGEWEEASRFRSED